MHDFIHQQLEPAVISYKYPFVSFVKGGDTMNLHDDENKHSCCKNEGADSTSIKDPVCSLFQPLTAM